MKLLNTYLTEKLKLSADVPNTGLFGGLEIAPGNLIYNGSKFMIANKPTKTSRKKIYGLQQNSTYFTFYELGEVLDNKDYKPGIIKNTEIEDGWRIPSIEDFEKIFGKFNKNGNGSKLRLNSPERSGSIVNDIEHVCHIPVKINNEIALLLFPDDKVINIPDIKIKINDINTEMWMYPETKISSSQLNTCINKGCAVIYAYGMLRKYSNKSDDWWRTTSLISLYTCDGYEFDSYGTANFEKLNESEVSLEKATNTAITKRFFTVRCVR